MNGGWHSKNSHANLAGLARNYCGLGWTQLHATLCMVPGAASASILNATPQKPKISSATVEILKLCSNFIAGTMMQPAGLLAKATEKVTSMMMMIGSIHKHFATGQFIEHNDTYLYLGPTVTKDKMFCNKGKPCISNTCNCCIPHPCTGPWKFSLTHHSGNNSVSLLATDGSRRSAEGVSAN